MKYNHRFVVLFAGLSLLTLASCASEQPSATENSPAVSASVERSPSEASAVRETPAAVPSNSHSHGGQGGQVIETGEYHLELVTIPEATGTHLDFFLQKGDNHEAIPNAKVTAQIQLPNGTQQSLDMSYDAQGKHYAVLLPATATGEYKVAILSDIGGKKVNGRFTFTK
jgi:hypothetical protein